MKWSVTVPFIAHVMRLLPLNRCGSGEHCRSSLARVTAPVAVRAPRGSYATAMRPRDPFDSELLIDEVEKRPAIWDHQCQDYTNKVAKNRAWQELVAIFADGDDNTAEQKSILRTTLQKKWRNIRDCYIKEYKKLLMFPSKARREPKYMYFSRLSFLERSTEDKYDANLKKRDRTDSLESQNEDNEATEATSETSHEEYEEVSETRPFKRKKRSVSEEVIPDTIFIEPGRSTQSEVQESSNAEHDDEKLFCMSLYSELKKVPESRRLATKIELLQVLQKGQSCKLEL